MTKNLIKTTAALALGAMVAGTAFAGTGKTFKEEVVIEEPTQWWNAELSTGYDSLYMFRGVNVLRNNEPYGSGIYWTNLSATFNITENDSLSIGTWMGFGVHHTSYKEFDAFTSYTHAFGDLSLSFGYSFYYVLDVPLYSHELNAGLAYEFDLGFMSLTPGITYYFNIGPDSDTSGIAAEASSFLQLRLDGSVPVYNKGAVSLDPWVSFGTNFDYNTNYDGNAFSGLNNLEFGLAMPIQLSEVVSISPYAAFSQVINSGGLLGTRRSTFWGGGAVTFSF